MESSKSQDVHHFHMLLSLLILETCFNSVLAAVMKENAMTILAHDLCAILVEHLSNQKDEVAYVLALNVQDALTQQEQKSSVSFLRGSTNTDSNQDQNEAA